MPERTEADNQVAPDTVTDDTGRMFGILSEKPTLEELAEQIKLGAEMYAELKLEVYDVLNPLMEALEIQDQFNKELFDLFVGFGLKANYIARETEALKEDNQHHFSQVHSNKKRRYLYE